MHTRFEAVSIYNTIVGVKILKMQKTFLWNSIHGGDTQSQLTLWDYTMHHTEKPGPAFEPCAIIHAAISYVTSETRFFFLFNQPMRITLLSLSPPVARHLTLAES